MVQQFWIRVAAMEGFPDGASGKESSGNEKKWVNTIFSFAEISLKDK